MSCVTTLDLLAPCFSCPYSARVFHDIIFLVATNNCFLARHATLSRQDFFKSLTIFYHDKKLFGCNRFFFSGSCSLLSYLSRHRIMCCDTIALAILSSLLQFLSIPTFLCRDKILSFLSFYYHDRKLLCRDKSSAFKS